MNFLAGWKTYIGVLITIIGGLSGVFGWNLGDLAGVQDQIISLIGSAIALYGRFVAQPKV